MIAPAEGLAEACAAAVGVFGLSIEASEAGDNPDMPHDRDGLRHWDCLLACEGGASVSFRVSLGTAHGDGPPSAAFALSLLLADVGLYRDCEGFEEFARSIGADAGDGAASAAWTEIGRIDSDLSAALGPEAVASLVAGEAPVPEAPAPR